MIDAKKLLDVFAGAAQHLNAGQPARPDVAAASATPAGDGSLGGLLEQLKGAVGQGGAGGGGGPAGGLADILGQVLGQATQGVREAAGRANEATGIGSKADEALRQATGGQGVEDLLGAAKELMKGNQMATGAVLGGLAAILLGTKTGRGAIGTAAKVGGLALIGGLAYKALQNYQAGRPILSGATEPVAPAPSGSGFEPDAVTNDDALLYLRAMIAAASADGIVDAAERQRIGGALSEAGLDAQAARFIEQEMARPATVEELAAGAGSPQVAMQLYAAARLAVDPSHGHNRAFLESLAAVLGIDADLAAHIEQQAIGMSV